MEDWEAGDAPVVFIRKEAVSVDSLIIAVAARDSEEKLLKKARVNQPNLCIFTIVAICVYLLYLIAWYA